MGLEIDGSVGKVLVSQALGPEFDPDNQHKTFRCSVVIPAPRQRQADPWGLLDTQPSLTGELQIQ